MENKVGNFKDIDECFAAAEAYYFVCEYDKASQYCREVLKANPEHGKASQLLESSEWFAEDPPANYKMEFSVGALGVALLITCIIVPSEFSWLGYTVSSVMAITPLIGIRGFMRTRLIPYFKGRRDNLFKNREVPEKYKYKPSPKKAN